MVSGFGLLPLQLAYLDFAGLDEDPGVLLSLCVRPLILSECTFDVHGLPLAHASYRVSEGIPRLYIEVPISLFPFGVISALEVPIVGKTDCCNPCPAVQLLDFWRFN